MKIKNYKRQAYKFLPADILREIYISRKKQISYSSYILVSVCALALAVCGILGWVTVFTSLYGGAGFMTPAYVFTIIFCTVLLAFGCGIRAESRFCLTVCIILFSLLFAVGLIILILNSNVGEIVTSVIFLFISTLSIYFYSKLYDCFKDMDELRKLDGFPRFIEYAITKDDFEKRVK